VVGRMGDALPWRVRLGDTVTDLSADEDSCTLTPG
jgi:alpha-D-xyloside xylohydrolase